jgi:aspartate-semialdehyde dehydrogenase
MSERIPVGVLGATGMVGQKFVSFLENHPWFDLTWVGASDRSAGKKYREATSWRKPAQPWFRIRAIIAWMKMCRCWSRRSMPIICSF